MKYIVLFLLLFCFPFSFRAQNKRSSYTQYGFSVPLKENTKSNSDNWFIPDGLNAKIGGGFHYNKIIALGVNTGMDWIYSKKLVVVPAYGTLKLSNKIGNDLQLFAQAGYGESIVIGRQGMTGDYKKIGLGIEDNSNGFGLIIEFTQYGIYLQQPEKVWNISIGISITNFKIRN